MLEQPLCYPLKSSAKDLPNEVRPDTFFQLRQTKHFFTHSNTLDQKCHIISKCSHNLKALSILLCLICVIAMNAVPVLAGCYRHTGDCEKFVELIKRCRTSASSCRHYRSVYCKTIWSGTPQALHWQRHNIPDFQLPDHPLFQTLVQFH